MASIIPISIHAPTIGATRSFIQRHVLHRISIHAPTIGATAIIYKKNNYFPKLLSIYPNLN